MREELHMEAARIVGKSAVKTTINLVFIVNLNAFKLTMKTQFIAKVEYCSQIVFTST